MLRGAFLRESDDIPVCCRLKLLTHRAINRAASRAFNAFVRSLPESAGFFYFRIGVSGISMKTRARARQIQCLRLFPREMLLIACREAFNVVEEQFCIYPRHSTLFLKTRRSYRNFEAMLSRLIRVH